MRQGRRRKFCVSFFFLGGGGGGCGYITKTCLFKYIEKITIKNLKFSDKISIFHISVQNIDCEYLLEPPRRGGSNEYSQSMFF